MGNCMERYYRESSGDEERRIHEEEEVEESRRRKIGFVEESDEFVKGGVKVKIVLTKEELEWLMLQLKNNNDNSAGKKLEEILEEIERVRKRDHYNYQSKLEAAAWKPSLESIMESPEVPEFMDRSLT